MGKRNVSGNRGSLKIAYLGGFHDTLMDYTANGLGDAANENAGRNDGYDPEHEYNLYDAIEAAHYFLNIPNDETKVRMNVVPTQNNPHHFSYRRRTAYN